MNARIQRPSNVCRSTRHSVLTRKIDVADRPVFSNWVGVRGTLTNRIEAAGVRVEFRRLGAGTTGVFDGSSITVNSACDLETQCHNLVHSFGHIVQWSLERSRCEKLYDALYAAKAGQRDDRTELEAALGAFREYEEEASRYAAWLLIDTGNSRALPSFHLFARADIEAIIEYHRHGVAPIWKNFYSDWRDRYIRGEFELRPFVPKAIPRFTPVAITPQEVIQGTD